MRELMKHRNRLVLVFAALVALRLLFHAVYLPIFEGPDEPFHLARIDQIRTDGLGALFSEQLVDKEIVGTIQAHPCGPDLQRAFSCQPFSGDGAFNILAPNAPIGTATPYENYEAHQPPLYYLFGAGIVSLGQFVGASTPKTELLILRLMSVVFVVTAMMLLVNCFNKNRTVILVVLGFLLLPGAAESLARCANDSAVFLWATTLVWATHKRPNATLAVVVLVGIGPLIKLTALPISVFGVFWLLRERNAGVALLGILSTSAVFSLQLLRGWGWGGTVELNAVVSPLNESVGALVVGFIRTVYTFVKTTWWLGGWSFFRAPTLVVLISLVLLIGWALTLRIRRSNENSIPHLAAIVTLVTAFVYFAVKHRLYHGVWGGVGGWYAWGWFPYFCLLVTDCVKSRQRTVKPMLCAGLLFLVATNTLWFLQAIDLYGF